MNETNDVTKRLNQLVTELYKNNWAEFARALDLTPSTVHGIKTGNDFRISQLSKIVEATGISADWLLLGTGEMKSGYGSLQPTINQAGNLEDKERLIRELEDHLESKKSETKALWKTIEMFELISKE